MKKITVAFVSLGLVALLTASAWAGPWGYGPGRGQGPGYAYSQLSPEQRAELDKQRADYLKETLELRQQLASKRIELTTLAAQPDADQAKIKALSNEVVDLQGQLAKKRIEYFGGERGPGAGYCAGLGGGFGRGMGRGFGGGYGPGACWR